MVRRSFSGIMLQCTAPGCLIPTWWALMFSVLVVLQACLHSVTISRKPRILLKEGYQRGGRKERNFPTAVHFDTSTEKPWRTARGAGDNDEFGDLPTIDIFMHPDYGGLKIHSLLLQINAVRKVEPDDERIGHEDRLRQLNDIDKSSGRDISRFYDPPEELSYPRKCQRASWNRKIHPVCNNIHETITLDRSPSVVGQSFEVSYLAHGYYRDTFLLESLQSHDNDEPALIVAKESRYDHPPTRKIQYMIHSEAILMDAMQASPVTSRTYGHCASSIWVEHGTEVKHEIVPKQNFSHQHPAYRSKTGRIHPADLDRLQVTDVHPMNNLTVSEKLDIAIAVAQSLAELHGFSKGAVTNDDISLDQWLRATSDGRIILNDFNNAIPLEYNNEKQEYCQYWTSFSGTFKSPEEYVGTYVDTSVDIWPMGNVIFTLLTGLYPYYNETDGEKIQEITQQGAPYIDPRYKTRSLVEGRMVDIMNQCHKLDPQERVKIFDVVKHLQETKRLSLLANKATDTLTKPSAHTNRLVSDDVKDMLFNSIGAPAVAERHGDASAIALG